jgi:hypothetical protein
MQKKASDINLKEVLQKTMERYHPSKAKDKRIAVFEVTPAYTEFGYYGRDIPEKSRHVATLKEESEIEDFLMQYNPDKGNHFEFVEQLLFEVVSTKWIGHRKLKV